MVCVCSYHTTVYVLILFELVRSKSQGALNCQHVTLLDWFQTKTYSTNAGGKILSFHEWSFDSDQRLLKSFPLDQESNNHVRIVKNALFSRVNPTPFSTRIQLAAYSHDVLTQLLDLNPSVVTSPEFLSFVAGNTVLPGTTPLAHRYGGHQFGFWAGQLGDGRAHLLGEYVSYHGDRHELQLKGSGKTPYSRDGDGRAVVRSSVREFLGSEAMHHLGIPTSRAATLVISDDKIVRDQFYDGHFKPERGAVVLRLAPSWLRFGSFEILADSGETELLADLADFVIRHYFPGIDVSDPNRYLSLYSEVLRGTADLVARWQSVGFVHGVCNTDNFSIVSVTIDYGPFGFMDAYDPGMVPNTSDDEGLYSYERQPDVGRYNLEKLSKALSHLMNTDQKRQLDYVTKGYADIYKSNFMNLFRNKLGLSGTDKLDQQLVALFLKMMEEQRSDFTMTFRQLGGWSLEDMKHKKMPANLWALSVLTSHKTFWGWVELYISRLEMFSSSLDTRQRRMHATNPRYVLRNWIAQSAISGAERDDFRQLRLVMRVLQQPYQQQLEAERLGFADPPPSWADELRVSCSS